MRRNNLGETAVSGGDLGARKNGRQYCRPFGQFYAQVSLAATTSSQGRESEESQQRQQAGMRFWHG